MAIYEYRCTSCETNISHESEMRVGPTLTQCPFCSSETIVRVYSPVGISFKGNGFYSTDKGD